MSEDQTKTLRPLRWWFWLVLFAPALVFLGGTATIVSLANGFGGLVFVTVFIALPLNFICSNAAAKQLVLLRDSRGGSSPWMFLWGPLIFFLNVTIAFGGSAAMEQFARSIR